MVASAIKVGKTTDNQIIVSLPYNPAHITKLKTMRGYRWHPKEKYWSFPNSDSTLKKILKVFEGEEIHIEPTLQYPKPVIATPINRGKQSLHNFEDLRRELVSRKYSYKTVKGYLYYNRDFLSFTDKHPSEIGDTDIKNYLFYLAEEKQAATSTINQAINALKFYYGTVLKRKFPYEIKRPRKDKKLPIVLSKEEVTRILSSVENLKHRAILMLVYSAGLRVGEVVKLKLEDIDNNRMLIHIKGAKGRKDRYAMAIGDGLGNT